MEEQILEYWKKNKIFERSIEQRDGNKEFVFYDGPPFATGLPHFGHFVPGTIKDIIPRYQTMRGHKVSRRFGWDCHGLPVEYEMEKELGISGKERDRRLRCSRVQRILPFNRFEIHQGMGVYHNQARPVG